MANILTCYYRPKPGGLCTRLFRAIQALLKRGHSVHYLAVAPFPIDHPRCVFHRFPWPARQSDTILFWAVFHLLAPMMLLFIAVRYHITHAFAFGPTYAFAMHPLRWMRLVVVTLFLRGDPILSHQLRHRPLWLIELEKVIEGRAVSGARVVAVSPHLLHTVLRRHPKTRPAVRLVLANDLPLVAAENSRELTLPLRLAVVGMVEPMKNQAFAVEVLNRIALSLWRLFIYGTGPDQPKLSAAVSRYGLESQVAFMGWVPNEKIWPRTDLLLAPSLHEGMPNAVLEAIAHSVPVLASDISAHRNILPPDLLLPLNRPEKWQAALLKVFADPERILTSMAQNQNSFAAHLRFDWDDRISRIIISN